MAINIGAPAIDREATYTTAYIYIALDTPAPFDGTLTTVELWPNTNLTNVKIGVLSRDGHVFTPRDYAVIGNVTGGSKQTIPDLSIDVLTGDCIGIYYETGRIEGQSTGGAGMYRKYGDQWDAGAQTYSLYADRIFSLGGWVDIGPPAPAKRSYAYIIG